MSVYRVEKTSNFTIMSNRHLQDRRLSLKAKGLLSYMLSLPDDWDYSVRGLAVCCKEGADAIRHAIHELEANGYLRRTTDRSSGKISGQIYDIFEEPIDVEKAEASEEPALDSPVLEEPTLDVPMLDKPVLDFPILDFPTLENPTQDFPTKQSTKEQNTNIQNTYQSNARINQSYPSISIERVEEKIRDQIGYDRLVQRYDPAALDGLIELMLEATLSLGDQFRIAGKAYPVELVRERFGALTYQHMAQVMDRLNRQVNPVSNIRDYLLSVLFRAAAEGEDEHDQAV